MYNYIYKNFLWRVLFHFLTNLTTTQRKKRLETSQTESPLRPEGVNETYVERHTVCGTVRRRSFMWHMNPFLLTFLWQNHHHTFIENRVSERRLVYGPQGSVPDSGRPFLSSDRDDGAEDECRDWGRLSSYIVDITLIIYFRRSTQI